jgi:hypothetical protein
VEYSVMVPGGKALRSSSLLFFALMFQFGVWSFEFGLGVSRSAF